MLLSEETEAVTLKKRAGAAKVVGFDHENGAVVGDETGTVVEIDVIGSEQLRDRLQLRGLHGYKGRTCGA